MPSGGDTPSVLRMRLFNRTEHYADGSSYRYRWYECNPFYQLALVKWSLTRKGWHPRHKRLARLRHLYWTLIRFHNTEICACCGGPVGVVYWAPDAVWEAATGYGLRHPSGEAAPGVLCPKCLSDLAKEAGLPFLRWTCSTDDSALMLDDLLMQLRIENEKHPNYNITKLLQRAAL